MSRLAALRRLGPGFAMAATGVGAGDLAAASVAGVRYGTALAWAVAAGALIKFVLNEGIARWQLRSGETVLDAAVARFHPALSAYLGLYFLLWTPAVAMALGAACGIATEAAFPVLGSRSWGALHAAVAGAAVLAGGYRLFETGMKALIAVMFVTLVGSAAWMRPGPDVLRGLVVPSLPPDSAIMVLSILGGIGGSVTLLAYGYWIDEKGWRGRDHLGLVRLDLGVAYGLTGLFGVALVVLAASLGMSGDDLGGGTGLLVALAAKVGEILGPAGRAVLLAGVWAAVFTSMLGVWHGVPALLADFLRAVDRRLGGRRLPAAPPAGSRDPLHAALVAGVAITSAAGVWLGQPLLLILTYTVLGSLFMPLLAFLLLRLNSPRGPLGRDLGNRPATAALLWGALALFLFLGLQDGWERLAPLLGG